MKLRLFFERKAKKKIFLFAIKNVNRVGESASLFCFLDGFRMQLSGELKGISSAGVCLCSFLDFLHVIADWSSGNV